jgi:hypothetical protein
MTSGCGSRSAAFGVNRVRSPAAMKLSITERVTPNAYGRRSLLKSLERTGCDIFRRYSAVVQQKPIAAPLRRVLRRAVGDERATLAQGKLRRVHTTAFDAALHEKCRCR